MGGVAHAVSTKLRIVGCVDNDIEEEDTALMLLPKHCERETPSLVPTRRA